jgi:hypothetical protein
MVKGLAKTSHFALPPGTLDASMITWTKGKLVHRVHLDFHPADSFNASGKGNARFSPLVSSKDVIVPTIYAGETEDCALMETVFHDVPFTARKKSLRKGRFEHQLHSLLRIDASLNLIDLGTIALRRLGIERKYLIDTTKAHYPSSRQWALALYEQNPAAQGLCWTSRQDDRALAIMLFGDRVPDGVLLQEGDSEELIQGGFVVSQVLELADRLGVRIVH